MKKSLLYLLTLAMLSGCSHSVDLGKFKESSMDQKTADILPPQHVIDKKQPKVAVLPFGEPSEYSGKLSNVAQEGLTQLLSKGCGMEVVERSQTQKFFDEKKFAGSLDVGADFSELTKMVQGIDYVILGSVTNTNVGASFTASQTTYDKKGKSYTSKPYCSVSGQATVNIRVVNASTGTIDQALQPIKGTTSGSFEVAHSGQCGVKDPASVVTQAVENAIKKAKRTFLEAYPRFGYLYKTMTGVDGNRIAYINLGKLDGIKAGDNAELVRYVKEVDRIKKIERLTTQKIADVKISDTDLQDDRCIIIIPDEYSAQIMPGLAVKTKFNGSGLFGLN
jgi:curli biogenesis system outer membrane secretion channel CsgG